MSSLTASHIIDFDPFRLDLRAGQLSRDGIPVKLRPKTFAVLEHLAQRPGELVPKEALLQAVWGDVAVSEDVARLSIRELREALGDERAAPRFIETVPRRGYRFIAKPGVVRVDTPVAGPGAAAASLPGDALVVGRSREAAEIARWLEEAASGRRQVGFVTGEPGIGKTTLVDTALRDLRRSSGSGIRIARGQCVEQYGGGEPYLPVLDALATLGRGPEAPSLAASLAHAPPWLLRVLGSAEMPEHDGAPPAGASEHTLQRLATCLDTLAADKPFVLVVEDVQWSDYSTLDLLSVVARRRDPARLLVLCTLRPADAIVRGHPVADVKRELLRTGQCREILLGGLSPAEIAAYLAARFSGAELPADLLPLLVERSAGNPFFMVALVDQLIEQGLLVSDGVRWELRSDVEQVLKGVPEGLRAAIEPRVERLADDELRVLEVASVAGPEFAADAVASVAAPGSELADVEYVEQLCDGLARRHDILRAAGERAWPDGTTSERYAFRHALYQDVVYQRLGGTTRRRLHQALGEHLEQANVGRTGDVANVLAAHFERSRDLDRAVRYHAEAAARARSRSAFREARFHLETGLDLLRQQPDTPDRLRREMACLQDLGQMLFAIEGYGGESGAGVFERMRRLAGHLDGDETRLRAMEGELAVLTMRADFTAARTLSEEMLVLAERLGDPTAIANTSVMRGAMLYSLGEVEAAHHVAERGMALFDPAAPPLPADIGILGEILLACACGYLGRVARAQSHYRNALARAATLDTTFQHALATNFAAQVCSLIDDGPRTRALADETVRLATENDFSFLRLTGLMVRGARDVEDGRIARGLADVRTAFEEYRATGQRYNTTYYSALLVRAHLAAGALADAHHVVDSALAFAAETGERLYEPELLRLKAECLLAGVVTGGTRADATRHLEQAITGAAERKGLLFEVRATVSLCRLQEAAHERLARLVARFAPEDDCADLRRAREMLDGRDAVARLS